MQLGSKTKKWRSVMLTAGTSALPQESFNYSPEDLEIMRHAFRRAREENPLATKTEAQCYSLAKAIVNRFQPGIDETELIAVALKRLKTRTLMIPK
jgi:hypothetical protein